MKCLHMPIKLSGRFERTLSNEHAHYVYDKLSKMVARSKILLLFVRKGLGT